MSKEQLKAIKDFVADAGYVQRIQLSDLEDSGEELIAALSQAVELLEDGKGGKHATPLFVNIMQLRGVLDRSAVGADIEKLAQTIIELVKKTSTAAPRSKASAAAADLGAVKAEVAGAYQKLSERLAKLVTFIENINPMFNRRENQDRFADDIERVVNLVHERHARLTDGKGGLTRGEVSRWKTDAEAVFGIANGMVPQGMGNINRIDWDAPDRMWAEFHLGNGGGGDDGKAPKKQRTVPRSENVAHLEKEMNALANKIAETYGKVPCLDAAVVLDKSFGKIDTKKLSEAEANQLRAEKLHDLDHALDCNNLEKLRKQAALATLRATAAPSDDELQRLTVEISEHEHHAKLIRDKKSRINKGQEGIEKAAERKAKVRNKDSNRKGVCGANITRPTTSGFKPVMEFSDAVIPHEHGTGVVASNITADQQRDYATSVVSMLKSAHPSVTFSTEPSLNWVFLNSVLKGRSLTTESDAIDRGAYIERVGADAHVYKIKEIINLVVRHAHDFLPAEDSNDPGRALTAEVYATCDLADLQIRRNIYLLDVELSKEEKPQMEHSTMNALLAKVTNEHHTAVTICFGLWVLARAASPLWDASDFGADLSTLFGCAQPPDLEEFHRVREKWANMDTLAPMHKRALCAAIKAPSAKEMFVDDVDAYIYARPDDIDEHEWIANIITSDGFVQAANPMAVTPMGILTVPPFQGTDMFTALMIDMDSYDKFKNKEASTQLREFAVRVTFWLLLNTQFHRLSLQRRIHLCLALCIDVPAPDILNSRMDAPFIYEPFVHLLEQHKQRPCAIECVRLINWFWGNAFATAKIHEAVVEWLVTNQKPKNTVKATACMKWALTEANFEQYLIPGLPMTDLNYECANYDWAFPTTATTLPVAMRFHVTLTALLCVKEVYAEWAAEKFGATERQAADAHQILKMVIGDATLDVLHGGSQLSTPRMSQMWGVANPEYVVAPSSVATLMGRAIDRVAMQVPRAWDMTMANDDDAVYDMQTSGRRVATHILSRDAAANTSVPGVTAKLLASCKLDPFALHAMHTIVGAALIARKSNEDHYLTALAVLLSRVGDEFQIDREARTIEFGADALDATDLSMFHVQGGWDKFGPITKFTAVFAHAGTNDHGCMCVHNAGGDVRAINVALDNPPSWCKSCVRDHLLDTLIRRIEQSEEE